MASVVAGVPGLWAGAGAVVLAWGRCRKRARWSDGYIGDAWTYHGDKVRWVQVELCADHAHATFGTPAPRGERGE